MSLYSIRYKGCLAQQDTKTLEVFVRKIGGTLYPEMRCLAGEKLSAKELRMYVNRYLTEVVSA